MCTGKMMMMMMVVVMIASYIRKNKEDRRLRRYLKEMAFVRKR